VHEEHDWVRVSVNGPIRRQVVQLVHSQTEEPNHQNFQETVLEIVPNRKHGKQAHFAASVFTKRG
jgi:hypothetical protein